MTVSPKEVVQAPAREWQTYPKYEDSGVGWLGEIPEHWKVQRLRYICTLNPSKSESRGLPANIEVSFVPMEKVGEGGGLSLDETRVLGEVQEGYTYFRNRDVVIAKITPCFENGKGALCEGLVGGVGFGTTELQVLRALGEHHPKFVFYLTMSDAFRRLGAGMMKGSAGQKRVPDEFTLNFKLGVPAPHEQRAIATFLDRETVKIDALIAKRERLMELLEEKRNALISQAVTKGLDPEVPTKDSGVEWVGKVPEPWRVMKVKRLCQVRRGASPRPIDDPIYFDDDGEYAWVRISDVTASKKYLRTTEQRLSPLGQSKSVPLEPGELFVSIAGSVGKPIITSIKCCIHDGFVYFVRLTQNREYLYYVFSGGEVYKGLGKLGTQLGSGSKSNDLSIVTVHEELQR